MIHSHHNNLELCMNQILETITGSVSAVNCTGMWENKVLNVEAGQIAKFIINQRDMYGNAVFSKNSTDTVPFTAKVLKASDRQPVFTSVMSFQPWGDRPTDSQVLTFQIWEDGSHFLEIKSGGENIYGSPFPFTCTTGNLFSENDRFKFKFMWTISSHKRYSLLIFLHIFFISYI